MADATTPLPKMARAEAPLCASPSSSRLHATNRTVSVKRLDLSPCSPPSMSLTPTARYTSPDTERRFHPGAGPHTTWGTTTGPSEVVANKGAVDKDLPTSARDTPLGHLRAQLTTLQDQVNGFLTARMKDTSGDATEVERRILDDGVDEDD